MHEVERHRDVQGKGKALAGSSSAEDHRGGFGKRRRTHQLAPAKATAAPFRAPPITQAAPLKCFNCGELGHFSSACTKPRRQGCFACGQAGHFARDCTRPRAGGQGVQQRPYFQHQLEFMPLVSVVQEWKVAFLFLVYLLQCCLIRGQPIPSYLARW